MDGKLLCKVVERMEAVAGVKPFLVLPVTALHFTIVTGLVGTNEIVPNTELDSGGLKQGGQVPLAVGKAVGELKTVVRLDALHSYSPAGVPPGQLLQEIRRGIGGLFRVCGQEAQAGELINGGVLVQAEFRVCDTRSGNYFHIHLDPLAGIGHLLIGLGFLCLVLLSRGKQSQLPHHAEQAFRAAGIAPHPQPVPKLHHAKIGVAAAHVPDHFQLRFCVLVGMAVGPSGATGQGCHAPIPPGFPKVDVRPTLVVLPAGSAHAVLFCILHQGFMPCPVLYFCS